MPNAVENNGKNFAEALHELREDFKDFVSTRLQMLQVEIKEKIAALKVSLPALLIGCLALLTAFFLFTAGLVSVIAVAFAGSPYAYPLAFFIVCALYALGGGAITAFGIKSLLSARLKPERTLRVLKQDQIWLQSEVRTQV
jgi:uncharacterized membrane protein YqjE